MSIFNDEWILKTTNYIRSQVDKIYVYADDEKIEGVLDIQMTPEGKISVIASWEQPDFVQKSCEIQYVEIWDKDGMMILRKPPDTPTNKVQGMNFWFDCDLGLIEVDAPKEGG